MMREEVGCLSQLGALILACALSFVALLFSLLLISGLLIVLIKAVIG